MTKLSVNVNKIATLRNARGGDSPNVLKMALLIESLGADGITVHPRPDERHIKKSDVRALKDKLSVEFNIEGYPSPDFIALIHEIKPEQVTLVPDPPHVITSNAGFKLTTDFSLVKKAISELKPSGTRISIFIDPADFLDRDIAIIKDTGADRIELYTERFATHANDSRILLQYADVAARVKSLGLGINAGHDLSLDNLEIFLAAIPFVDEVSIGHALISDALILGMPETITRYLALVHKPRR
jgi:pyridoxine 5-phosphate synthase